MSPGWAPYIALSDHYLSLWNSLLNLPLRGLSNKIFIYQTLCCLWEDTQCRGIGHAGWTSGRVRITFNCHWLKNYQPSCVPVKLANGWPSGKTSSESPVTCPQLRQVTFLHLLINHCTFSPHCPFSTIPPSRWRCKLTPIGVHSIQSPWLLMQGFNGSGIKESCKAMNSDSFPRETKQSLDEDTGWGFGKETKSKWATIGGGETNTTVGVGKPKQQQGGGG